MIELLPISVPIYEIRDDRGRDIEGLVKSLRGEGLRQPIIVQSGTGLLIDGIRRIEAAKKIGHKEIIAIVTDDFDEVVGAMLKSREDGVEEIPHSPRRIYDIYNIVGPMGRARLARARALGYKQEDGRKVLKLANGSYREAFARAVTGGKPNHVSASLNLYRRLESGEGTPAYRQALISYIDQMEQGLIGPEGVVLRLKTAQRRLSSEMPVAEQKHVIRSALSTMEGLMKGVEETTISHDAFPPGQREKLLNDALALKRAITTWTTHFRKGES